MQRQGAERQRAQQQRENAIQETIERARQEEASPQAEGEPPARLQRRRPSNSRQCWKRDLPVGLHSSST